MAAGALIAPESAEKTVYSWGDGMILDIKMRDYSKTVRQIYVAQHAR